jgi:hypothetical protein
MIKYRIIFSYVLTDQQSAANKALEEMDAVFQSVTGQRSGMIVQAGRGEMQIFTFTTPREITSEEKEIIMRPFCDPVLGVIGNPWWEKIQNIFAVHKVNLTITGARLENMQEADLKQAQPEM